MKPLIDKMAIVTGAGKGIGRACAELLAENGATVVATARTPADVQQVSDGIAKAGGQAVPIPGDITDAGFVTRLFEEVHRRFGRLDILVNNAGMAPFGPVETLPVEKFRQCLELNVIAAFACMQQAVRLMKAGGGGKIVNIGSVRSHWTENGDAGAYNASKYAVKAMTESVARQLHAEGNTIAVSLVCPGVVDTPMTNPKGESRPTWLKPKTIAEAVLFAVSAPQGVNVYDLTVFSANQRPW